MANVQNLELLKSELQSGKWKKGVGYLHSPVPNVKDGKPVSSLDYEGNNTDLSGEYKCCLGVAECLMLPEERKSSGDNCVDDANYRAIGNWLDIGYFVLQQIATINDNNLTFEPVVKYLDTLIQEANNADNNTNE